MELSQNELDELRWRCRRGMLELDILLNNFVEKNVASLSAEDFDLFLQLLALGDQELHELFNAETLQGEYALLVRQVRACVV